ncbi:probable cytochrome P450 28d1 [Teleopsis dalmanni]|uniref:probable cytochrome P450 28d1 n=1 Tax=Teleopsis dalmanni TaxID=139649 RepID=UPI0018CED9D3|nr:probable cytochrome P450 28d1 [Teleopsis dalmanni]
MALLILLLIISALILAVISIIYLYLSWNFKYWQKRGVKGPKPILISGSFPKSRQGICNLIDELHEIYLYYKTTEKFVGLFSGRSPKLFIVEPKLAVQILTKHFKHFRDNESSKWTSPKVEKLRLCSPFVTTGDAWKERRAEFTPPLSINRLRAFYPTMRESAQKLVDFIKERPNEFLDTKELSNRYTTEFISNFIWGLEANAFTSTELSPIHEMANKMLLQSLKCVAYYIRTATWPWLRLLKPVPFFAPAADRFFMKLAADASGARLKSSTERCDVINHLLQLKEKKTLTDVQIAGHTTTVLIDGFETVANVISHFLLLLSRNDRVQEKLRQELINTAEDITFDELNELPYLDQCLHESLRIFPPLTILFKICTEEITLENSNNSKVTINPDDVVCISSYSFQHDADFYENPEDYWPERFDEAFGGLRKYREMGVYLPFGDGPRICPGMKLGLVEAKVVIWKTLRNFKLKPSERTRKDNKIMSSSFLLTVDGNIEILFEDL